MHWSMLIWILEEHPLQISRVLSSLVFCHFHSSHLGLPRLSPLSFQIMEHTGLHLGSLLYLFHELMLVIIEVTTIISYLLRIIVLHCLLSGILNNCFIVKPCFGCFRWEGKSLSCYSTLPRSSSQLPSLLVINMLFEKSISEPFINCNREKMFSHLFRIATPCEGSPLFN